MSGETGRFGLSAALATPFHSDGRIDLPRLVAHAASCLEGGCDSVTLFGTTGEGASIGMAERARTLGAMAGAGISGARLVAALSATSVEDAAEQAGMAVAVGCRALLLPPPFYFKDLSDDGLFAWHAALFARLPETAPPAILYNIPQLTCAPLSTGFIGRMRQAFGPRILGVKDSSCDWGVTEPLLETHGDLAILVGDERHLGAAVRRGGQGAISGVANLLPGAMRRLAHDGADDPMIAAVTERIVEHPVIPAIKALIAHRAADPAWAEPRPPLTRLAPQEMERLARDFDALAIG